MGEIGYITVRNGVKLRASPAREACYKIVLDQNQMAKHAEDSIEHRREILHSNVNDEIQSLEIAVQTIADFPDADWDLRLSLARQGWDEVRHAAVFQRRLEQLGGHKGEFPIINQEWGVVCMFDSVAARLAVQNRIFEGGSLDVIAEAATVWTDMFGDPETGDIFDGIGADEIEHPRFANAWLDRQKKTNPKALIQAVAGMSAVKAWAAALSPPEMKMEHDISVNMEDRRRAGFAAE
jgi:uncharacterized ferritin-like protein (DUF455 family)